MPPFASQRVPAGVGPQEVRRGSTPGESMRLASVVRQEKMYRVIGVMLIPCVGGGPAGLYFAIAMKRRRPDHEIVVVERNRPYDTFGWGVVLSDETLVNLTTCDPVSAEAIRREFVYWDDI